MLLALAASNAFAQFQGHFSLPKRTYPAGDRGHHIVATFTVKNVSGKPWRIVVAPQNLCGGYFVEITAIRPRRELKPGGIVGDCLGPNTIVLAPGESRVDNVDVTILDYNNFLDTPGDYRIRLVRNLEYMADHPSARSSVSTGGGKQRFATEFVVHMEPRRRD